MMKSALKCLALASLLVQSAVQAGMLVGVNDDTSDFYSIDPNTGAATFLGNGVISLSLTGLAYDPLADELWVSDTCDAECFGLGLVDQGTWEITEIGGFLNTSNIHALAHDSTRDILFGWDIEASQVVTLDRTTGEETTVGPVGSYDFVGMTYDLANDRLLAANRGDDSLYEIDPDTFAVNLIGAFGFDSDTQLGLAIDNGTGRLFLGDGDTFNLYEVNPSTGEATLIGNTGFVVDGLTVIGELEFAEDVPVPTQTPLGLLLMALMLGGLAWRRLSA